MKRQPMQGEKDEDEWSEEKKDNQPNDVEKL